MRNKTKKRSARNSDQIEDFPIRTELTFHFHFSRIRETQQEVPSHAAQTRIDSEEL